MVEIYDEDTLTEFELNRQRNIIKNFEFMKACGLPVKPLIYVKRVHVPLEEQFKYLSDESTDSSDEEWTLGPKKKKKEKKNEPKSADIRIKVSNPTEFFKQKKKREEEERNGTKEQGESSQEQQAVTKKRKRSSKKKKVNDDEQPSTSGSSSSSKPSTSGFSTSSKSSASGASSSTSSAASKTTSGTRPTESEATQERKNDAKASAVVVSAIKEKANGKQFIKERPKLPPATLKSNRSNISSDEDEDHSAPVAPFEAAVPDIATEPIAPEPTAPEPEPTTSETSIEPLRSRYPKREGQPRVDYSEAEVPDDDHYLFCAECNMYYQGECSKHLPIRPISDSTPSEGSLKARATLPEGMEIKKSGIKDAGFGVFSTMAFKSGATFGPYAGEKVRADVPKVGLDTSYMWEIVKDLKVVFYINGKNEAFANWMRYVNCSRNEEEQNMIAYQFHGKIFYRVYKDVEAGTEFLVWYGEEYAGELGIALEEKEPVNVQPGKFLTFKCDWCLICYAYEEALTKHKKYCSKKPAMKTAFDDGEANLSADGPMGNSGGSSSKEQQEGHQCHVCGKVLSSARSLKQHLLIHTGDKPFLCEQCGKRFSQQGNLKTHMLTHTGEQPFSCERCDKKFAIKCNLTCHMLVHTQEQPFKCELCGHRCNVARDLRDHMRVHSGERPYKCVVCGKGFTQSSNLRRHSRTHTGETPYKCTVCGKGFKESGNLKTHSRIHTGEKPYQCPHCEFKCSQKNNLNSHVAKLHRSGKK